MNPEYLNALVTFLVGFMALHVYWLSKRNERQNSAIIVIMDIRHAEQVVLNILDKGMVDRSMRAILTENNWGKYKHLFARDFSSDDFASFNRFFDACVEIEEARQVMSQVFYSNLHGKALAVQEQLLVLTAGESSSSATSTRREQIIKNTDIESYAFEPGEPKERVLRGLRLMGTLTNTIAFEKLKHIAKLSN